MQDRPDLEPMLAAVAHFLEREAVAACPDPAVAFRLRIAAHLVGVAAREVHSEGVHDGWQLDALEALLEQDAPLAGAERRDRTARRQAIRALERLLVERIDAGAFDADPAATAALEDYLRGSLERRLRVSNPRFDTTPSLP